MDSISIVTICFNNLAELIQTCNSVDEQKVKPFQHIIIDGSTNLEIKEYLQNCISPAYRESVSERDKGISDAFNKGVLKAHGQIVVILNSGDRLYDDSILEIVSSTFTNQPGIKWLHGKYKFNRGNQLVILGKPFEKSKLYRGMRSVSHQSMFVKKELYDKYGLYDVNEKIAMDYDFLCRIASEPFAFLTEPLIIAAPAGNSSVHYLQSIRDTKRLYEKYNPKTILLPLWHFRLRVLYYLLHSPVGNWLYKIKTKMKLENY